MFSRYNSVLPYVVRLFCTMSLGVNGCFSISECTTLNLFIVIRSCIVVIGIRFHLFLECRTVGAFTAGISMTVEAFKLLHFNNTRDTHYNHCFIADMTRSVLLQQAP